MLISIIQIRPLLKGAWLRGKPRRSRAASMRTIESRLTQLMTVCGHGARMPSAGQETQDATDGTKADASH